MSLETMTKINSVTVGAGGSSSIDFTNIPQGYTDLKVHLSLRGTVSDHIASAYMSINGTITNRSYTSFWLAGNASNNPYVAGTNSGTNAFIASVAAVLSTSNTFGNAELSLLAYSGSSYKSYSCESALSSNANGGTYPAYVEERLTAGLWSNSSPITSLSFYPTSGSWAQYSTATLYGVKNSAKTAGNSVKATGGSVVFDGTYTYHVFSSTGTFTPTQTLTADYLVVAGGGGGGWGHAAGGGAGGLRSATNQTLAATAYSVTVGAGGSTGTNYGASSKGTNGSDSVFNLITSTGGGAGGGTANGANANGNSGGSGGGGSYSLSSGYGYAGTGNTPSTSPSQGNDGAQGGTGPASGGGGGGAGGAGVQGTPGSGGIGSSAFSQWGTATGQGHNISGTYYFAGGGGGGAENYNGAPGGFGGGGNGATSGGTGSAGMPNTGGGGGGGSYTSYPGTAGGAGASGIVIIRYKG